ncbi:MAG TPA: SRPBCC family protein [Magnetospirillaceae bacterium]|jgi:carbon monoxide dehydrogenase subunit G
MATVRKGMVIEASPDYVWSAVRDVGALARVFPGVVKEVRMEGNLRVLTYQNGIVLREWVVTVDDALRRLVVCASGGRIAHFQSAVQVFAETPDRSHVVWTCDFLPDMLTETVQTIVDRGTEAAKGVLERGEY